MFRGRVNAPGVSGCVDGAAAADEKDDAGEGVDADDGVGASYLNTVMLENGK